jgi:hypothetical protein
MARRQQRRHASASLAAVAVLLLVAACGSSAALGRHPDNELRIGCLLPLTGDKVRGFNFTQGEGGKFCETSASVGGFSIRPFQTTNHPPPSFQP